MTQDATPRRTPVAAGRLVSLPDGKSYLIGATPLTIGREPSSNVPVHSDEASRSHAYILRTPQGFLLVAHDAPETSQYARTVPLGARPTGKLGLAFALAERGSWRTRMGTWIRRYGPSEVVGIAMALGGSWLLQYVTGSVIAAAYGASVGEALGFYGSLVTREMIQEAYFAGGRRAPYGVSEMMRTWRGLLLEFGPAELLDSGLIRPLAMAACTTLLGWGLGIVTGKILADVVFYLPVIWVYERRRRA